MTIFVAAACSRAPQIGHDRDESVNLRSFSTFKVEAEKEIAKDPLLGSELNQRRMTAGVIQAMEKKGYVVDELNPEIVVRFTVDVKDRQEVSGGNNYYPYRRWWSTPGNDITTYNYQESRLIVNIYQKGTDRMIWQGWLSGQVKPAGKKDNANETLKNIVLEILQTFPESTRI
ncbi:hypothetical protein Dfri01_23520 [Dyadobacter frigoris]|nr:hypothetical protein Dfri01_23520 [Dyadobacter frigoris]